MVLVRGGLVTKHGIAMQHSTECLASIGSFEGCGTILERQQTRIRLLSSEQIDSRSLSFPYQHFKDEDTQSPPINAA
jgi:hypothetical protein